MPNDWPIAVAFIFGLISVFAIIIFWGIRYQNRQQVKELNEINAETIREKLWKEEPVAAEFIYGIWQISMWSVTLFVKDQQDRPVGQILRDANGITIKTDQGNYRSMAQASWRSSAKLFALRDNELDFSNCICSWELKGWIKNRISKYTISNFGSIELPIRWGWVSDYYSVPLKKDGRVIGAWGGSRVAVTRWKVLALPSAVPLPARLFILLMGAGEPLKTKSL